MTGFGKAELEKHGYRHTLRLKSVNNRFLEIGLKLPSELWAYEAEARAMIQGVLSRGKLDIHWRDEKPEDAGAVKANLELGHAYRKALEDLAKGLALPNEVRLEYVARFPEVISASRPQGEEAEAEARRRWDGLKAALQMALKEMQESRQREGEALGKELLRLVESARGIASQIEALSAGAADAFADKLKKKLEALAHAVAVDPARLAQETAMLAERADIREEIVRLRTHLDEFERLLKEGGQVGKKLDFMSQELLREANTMGSKSPDAGLTKLVVALKSEIEKVKEQIQNLE